MALKGLNGMADVASLDEKLLREAQELTGIDDRDALLNEALRLLVQARRPTGLRRLRGKVRWEGDLDEIRRGRSFDDPR